MTVRISANCPVFIENSHALPSGVASVTARPSGWVTGRQAADFLGRPRAGIQTVLAHAGVPSMTVTVTIEGHTIRRVLYQRATIEKMAQKERRIR